MCNAKFELFLTDLNAQGCLRCPNPLNNMKLWNTHPVVYLDVGRTGEVKCPYCGTVYRLQPNELFQRHD